MVRSIVCGAFAAMLVCGIGVSRADDFSSEIDLSGFGKGVDELSAVQEDLPIEEVSQEFGTAARRFYISGMIGPSFATTTNPNDATFASSDTLFNAGGAFGVAFERQRGQLRLEVEGMGRSTYDAPFDSPLRPDADTVLVNNWSVMQNVWRDFMITDRFGVYGGGGIGAGGYTLGERFQGDVAYTNPAANFAWQAGGGLLWEISERLTFDVGYRYFQINTIEQEDYVYPNLFQASELMFTLRFYEPFRSWRN